MTYNPASNPASKHWERAIILVDMNAFFASVEQLDKPEWQGRPIGITNGMRGSCIITCSYEARAHGIRTGMRVKDAKRLCPDFIQVPARPERYAEISTKIMHSLKSITPDLEVFSVDEAFLDVTKVQNIFGPPEVIAKLVQKTVHKASGGALCSVGLSGDKTTAKYAAKQNKPNGLTIIPPWLSEERLRNVPVTELCGIAKGIGLFLARRGVHSCGDMKKIPISVLGQRFGNPGRRIWYMAQGLDPDPIKTAVPPPKSVGHGKVMPPNTTDPEVVNTFLVHMCEKVGGRLRKHELETQRLLIAFRLANGDWIGDKYRTSAPCSDGKIFSSLGKQLLKEQWDGEGVSQIQVTALDPRPAQQQVDMFMRTDKKRAALLRTVDCANDRYGEFTVAPARLLNRSDMPNVIAPAWKPEGHRQTI